MQIYSFNPRLEISSKQYAKSNPISFNGNLKAEDILVLIQDYITGKTNKKPNLDNSDFEAIYKYFGYEHVRTVGSHKYYSGPYNQNATIVVTKTNFKSQTADLVRGIENLDKLNGELFLFEHEPSDKEIEDILKKITTKEPVKGRVNKYSQKLKENQEEETDISDAETKINKQELYDTIGQQRMAVLEASQLTDECIEKFNKIKDDYESSKEELGKRNFKDDGDLYDSIETMELVVEELIAEAQKTINRYNSKFQNNETLSDEELKNLYDAEIKIEQNIDFMAMLVLDLETVLLEIYDREDAIKDEFKQIIEKLSEQYNGLQNKIKEYQKTMDKNAYGSIIGVLALKFTNQLREFSKEYSECDYDPKATDLTLEEFYQQKLEAAKQGSVVIDELLIDIENIVKLENEINKVSNDIIQAYSDFSTKVEKYQEIFDKNAYLVSKRDIVQTCKDGLKQAQKIAKEVEKRIKGGLKKPLASIEEYQNQLKILQNTLNKINSASKDFESIIDILNQEFVITEDELEQYKKERLEKTLKRFEKYQTQVPEEPEKEAKDNEEIQVEDTLIQEMENALNIINTQSKPVETSSNKESLLKKIQEFYSNPNNQKAIDALNTKIWGKKSQANIKFAKALAKKIAPLEFDETAYLLSYLISTYIKDADIESQLNNPNASLIFINNIGNKVIQSSEGQRINNATRFAFLSSVYSASKEKDGRIYNLDSKASKVLFDKVKKGFREIWMMSNNKQIDITLKQPINLQDVNYLIKAYVMPMKYNGKIDDVLDKLLEYSPKNDEQLRNSAKEFLKTQGMYYELLADDSCASELKTILLEAFWNDFDKSTGINMKSMVMENYIEKQREIKKQEQQKEKIDMFESMDWDV